MQGSPRMVGAEVLESRMLRDIYSERQLEAVMTDFWLNHFNVYIGRIRMSRICCRRMSAM